MDWNPDRIEADPQDDPHFRHRRNHRVGVSADVRLEGENWYQVEIKVRDLSACGFMAECAEPVGIGSYVKLDVPGVGKVDAQVRWQIGTRMGGMFMDPISLSECEWVAEKA